MITYFGFALADSMFSGDCLASRKAITPQEAVEMVKTAVSAVNPSHVPTLQAAKIRFGLEFVVPERAPQIELKKGDRLVLMSVRGLPRLQDRHEYTQAEIDSATFQFALWERTE